MSARKKHTSGGTKSRIPVPADSASPDHADEPVVIGTKRALRSASTLLPTPVAPRTPTPSDVNFHLGPGKSTRRQKLAIDNEANNWIKPSLPKKISAKNRKKSQDQQDPDIVFVDEVKSASPKSGGLGGVRTNSRRGLDQLKALQLATKQEAKNKELARQAKAVKFQGTSWVERNYPSGLDELFVHKKKIDEVQSWLKSALGLEGQNHRQRSKICVLTGPSGSGKTATMFLAAKDLNVEVKEWINPMSLTDFNFNRLGKFDADEVQGRSQQDLFSNFLFRASQYPSLPIKGRPRFTNRMVLVEDFPNVYFRDTPLFHNVLRSYNNLGGCPVVFIVPDSSSSESNCNKLFPKNIMQELNISCISLNAIAVTFMVKFLMNICYKEGVPVDKSFVEGIAIATGGDIRCAINTLQFKLMKLKQPASEMFKVPPTKKAPKPTSKDHKREKPQESVQKDETLFLFRALGKVLYSKRDDTRNVEMAANVPEAAIKFLRPNPLQEDPEVVMEKIEVQADTFLNFLQQNYLAFFGSLEDIVSASSILADSEYLLSRWPFDDSGSASKSFKVREAREELALLTASRGVMYSNVKKMPNAWRPLKKPMFGDVKSRLQKSADAVKYLFVSEGAVQQSFFTEVLPFYAKLLTLYPRLWATDEKSFISEIGTLRKGHRLRITQDTLQERDACEESGSDSEDSSPSIGSKSEINTTSVTVELHQKQGPNTIEEPEEEFMIEDYDD